MTTPLLTGVRTFDDSATEANLPSGQRVMLPVDGRFADTAASAARFSAVRWYTVTGDYRRAGGIDWETGNPCFTPAGLRGYVRGRRAMNVRARVYCDRADAADAVRALFDGGHGRLLYYPGLCWWISTLDGRVWTAQDLAEDLAKNWDAPEITADKLWACQYQGGPSAPLDKSVLFGAW